jgi:hypothetical protein
MVQTKVELIKPKPKHNQMMFLNEIYQLGISCI